MSEMAENLMLVLSAVLIAVSEIWTAWILAKRVGLMWKRLVDEAERPVLRWTAIAAYLNFLMGVELIPLTLVLATKAIDLWPVVLVSVLALLVGLFLEKTCSQILWSSSRKVGKLLSLKQIAAICTVSILVLPIGIPVLLVAGIAVGKHELVKAASLKE